MAHPLRLALLLIWPVTLVHLASPALAGCQSGSVGLLAYRLIEAGCQAIGTGASALAVGYQAKAADFGTALGEGARAARISTAVGYGAAADNTNQGATNIGVDSGIFGVGEYSTALGFRASATGAWSIAIGSLGPSNAAYDAYAKDSFTVSIGTGSHAFGVSSVAFGAYAGADPAGSGNAYNTALGGEAGRKVTGVGNTGAGLAAGHTVKGDLNTALGNSAGQGVTGNRNVAVGVVSGATVKGSYNLAMGDGAGTNLTGSGNVAVGQNAGRNITASNTTAIGISARATASNAIAIGSFSLATIGNTVSVGSPTNRRRIVNVANAVDPNDAVNLAQVQTLIRTGAALNTGPQSPASGSAGPIEPDGRAEARALLDDLRSELMDLRALVQQQQAHLERQQERIAQLEGRAAGAVQVSLIEAAAAP